MSLHPKGKSPAAKKTVFIGTHRTSVHVEAPFWESLKEIAATENLSLREIVTRINGERQHPNLSSEIRLYVLDHYRRIVEQGRITKPPN